MRRWWWIAVAVAVVAAGCTVDDAPATGSTVAAAHDVVIDSVPFLDGATLGPGEELRDGITVVDGSRVLGDTIPLQYFMDADAGDLDHGWAAMAVVTGDARHVLEAYASQAPALDLPVPELACVVPPGTTFEPASEVCAAESRSDDGLRSFRLDFVRSAGFERFEPASHVWITRQDMTAPPVSTEFFPPVGSPLDDPGVGSDLGWRPLPTVGEPYEHPTGSTTPTSFVVQEGTHLVGPPGPDRQSTGVDAVVAVLEVDGDVDQVVERYRTAFNPGYEHRSRSVQEGVRVDSWYWTNGDTATVDVYRRDGRPTFMMVWHAAGD